MLRSRSIFDEDMKRRLLPGQAVDGLLDRLSGQFQTLLPRHAAIGAGMDNEIFRAQGERTFYLPTKRLHGFAADFLRLAAEIDQVAGVDDQRTDAQFLAGRAGCAGLVRR